MRKHRYLLKTTVQGSTSLLNELRLGTSWPLPLARMQIARAGHLLQLLINYAGCQPPTIEMACLPVYRHPSHRAGACRRRGGYRLCTE